MSGFCFLQRDRLLLAPRARHPGSNQKQMTVRIAGMELYHFIGGKKARTASQETDPHRATDFLSVGPKTFLHSRLTYSPNALCPTKLFCQKPILNSI